MTTRPHSHSHQSNNATSKSAIRNRLELAASKLWRRPNARRLAAFIAIALLATILTATGYVQTGGFQERKEIQQTKKQEAPSNREAQLDALSTGPFASVNTDPNAAQQESPFGPLSPEAVNNYGVTRTTGITFSSISGTGTSVTTWRNGTSLDDNLSNNQPIGFTFIYNGGAFQNFRVSTNGFLTFNTSSTAIGNGSTSPYSFDNSALSASSAATNFSPNTLAPMWDDLTVPAAGTLSGNIKYLTTGVSPSRILTVEWIGLETFGNAGPDLNFQAKLYEADGHIEFVYGTMTASTSTYTYTTGVNAATVSGSPTAAELLTQQTANTATFNNTPSNGLTAIPAVSTQITLTPPVTTPAAATSLTFPTIGSSFATLNWVDNATNETNYNILISTDAGATYQTFGAIFGANTTGVTITGLAASTSYFFRVLACTEGVCSTPLDGSVTTNAPVSGTKTIGPGGDYTSFAFAVSDVNAGVGEGGVTFNVTPGTTFAENGSCITGGTAANPVVFQKSGAGANPIIQPPGSASTQDSGICILGGDFVTFDGIDVIVAGGNTTVEYGALLFNLSGTDGAQNNTIKNSRIALNRANTGSIGILQTFSVAATAASGTQSTNKYYNLTIENASRGILLNGGSTTFYDSNNEIGVTGGGTTVIGAATANDIGNSTASTYGIQAFQQLGVKIFNTEVRNVTGTGSGTVDGILLANTGATTTSVGTNQIFNNRIHDLGNLTSTSAGRITGISETLTNNAASISQIYNNFIWGLDSASTVTTSRRIIGIIAQSAGSGTASTHNVDFNSVRLAPTGVACPNTTFEVGVSTNVMKVRNNIFGNFTGAQTGSAKHYTWVTTATTTFGATGSLSDRNDLYIANTTNGFIALTSATDRTNLAAWQGAITSPAGAGDPNGKSGNPQFISATDLHISVVAPTVVESNGSFFAGVITWANNDIDGNARNVTTPDIGADEGTFISVPANDISADAIITPATGTLFVNGATTTPQASFSNAGTATQTSVSVQFTITGPGGYSYTNGQVIASIAPGVSTTVTFLIAPAFTTAGTYTTTATVLTADGFAGNNSVGGSFTVFDPITGGGVNVGTGQPYTSLTNAAGVFAAINAATVTSNITVNITSDLPGETGTIALNQFATPFTVTIKPSTAARIVSGSAATSLIRLDGADNVTIDGSLSGGTDKSLTFSNTNTSGAVVHLLNAATGNTVKNSVLQGVSTSTANGVVFFATVAAGTTGNSTNTIQNNDIRGGATASVYGVYNLGTSAAKNAGNTIFQNRIFDFSTNGIRDDGNSAAAIYSSNEIFEVTTQTTSLVGFRPSATSVDSFTFARNYIHDLNTSSTGSVYGIHLFDTNSAAATCVIVNNMITLSPTAPLTLRGIYDQTATGEKYNLYNNSIFIGGTVSGASNSDAYFWSIPSTSDARDNIFVNARTGGTGKHYAYHTNTTLANLTSDYNDIYNTGGTGNVFGNNGTADVANLATWKLAPTTGTGKDANSISADPQFASTTNLHITRTSPGTPSPVENNAGTPLLVGNDFDADLRAATPDIGADEVMTVNFSQTTYRPEVAGTNEGATAIITVNRTSGAGAAAVVNFTVGGGSATAGAACGAGVDYITPASLTLNFAIGETAKTFNIVTCTDGLFEGNETVPLTLTTVTGDAIKGSPDTATVNIIDGESQPSATIGDRNQVELDSGTSTFSFLVTLSGASQTATTINYSTADISATAGSDYVAVPSGSIIIPANTTTGNILITVNGDTTYEPNETFTVTITSPDVLIGSPSVGTGTILNDDGTPATLVVNTTADHDDGFCTPLSPGNDCTLREAINAANSNSGDANTIEFNISILLASAGVFTIAPLTPLPAITGNGTFVDGDTQKTHTGDTNATGPEIDLSGLILAGSFADGFVITSANNTIRGLAINGFATTGFANRGIYINGATATGNTIEGCYIGMDAFGFTTIANGNGVMLDNGATGNTIGGATAGQGNLISGNGNASDTGGGIYITAGSNNNFVLGNIIGTSADGTGDHGNFAAGVKIVNSSGNQIGGLTVPERNVVSGSDFMGVEIQGVPSTGNLVRGNYIGTNGAGTAAITNAGAGVIISGSASSNTIGGTSAAARNVISGNTDGVVIVGGGSSSNLVQGNFIGTDAAGTGSLGNIQAGVVISGFATNNTIGGAAVGAGNVISGNSGNFNVPAGVKLQDAGTTGNVVQGNFIGVEVDGTTALPNTCTVAGGCPGVLITDGANGNSIGGVSAGQANIIANGTGDGILVMDGGQPIGTAVNNSLRGNSIYNNSLLGINLIASGENLSPGGVVTANDPQDVDAGPNTLQNFPVITSSKVTGGTRTITGTLNTKPASGGYVIEFFSNTSCDGTNGEGKTYLGTITTSTTDGSGDVTPFTFHPTSLTAGDIITATATDTLGNTSEFSQCFTTATGAAGEIKFVSATYSVAENVPGGLATITVQRTGGSDGAIAADFNTADGSATDADNDYEPVTNFPFSYADGETGIKNVTVTINDDSTYEANETLTLTLSGTTILRPGGPTSNIGDSAVLTITNDDTAPTFAITSSVTHDEGDAGTTAFDFTVTKTGSTALTATVRVDTANVSASAPSDYTAIVNQVLSFNPASTTQTVTVFVNGDTTVETDETFTVTLSNPTNATIASGQGTGTGTITNDDHNADYTVTTSGPAIVVTDVSGNGDTLTISEPGGGQIRFAAPGRYFSVNGGVAILGNSGNLLIPTNSITVRAAGGDDTINVGAFTTSLPSLGISGGAGDDTVNFNGNLTFDPIRDLAVDLQSDPTPGIDTVNFAAGVNVILSGTAPATVKVSKNITFAAGSKLEVQNGTLTLEANQQGTPTAGTFVGVDLADATIKATGTGAVTVNGKGGTGTAGQYGVFVHGASGLIKGGNVSGSTTTTVVGTGGIGTAPSSSNSGVVVSGTISSFGGNVSVTGSGGSNTAGDSNDNHGVFPVSGGLITSEGNGNVTVSGTGGGGSNGQNTGVLVQSATITSGGSGTVLVNGTGGAGGGSHGVWIYEDGRVNSGGIGTVAVTGTGGGTSGHGVYMTRIAAGTASRINSGGGAITVTGTPAGGTGIFVNPTAPGLAAIASTGNAAVNLIADTINLDAANAAVSAGTGTVTLRQKTNAKAINLGGADSGTQLGLTDAELDRVTAGTLNIGDANSGAISVSANITRGAATVLNLTSGANIDIAGGSLNSAGGNVTLVPGTNVFPSNSGVDVTTSAATTLSLTSAKDLKIVINNATVDSGYTQLNVAGLVNLNGATLALSGTHVPVAGQTFTIVNNDSNDAITGTFAGLPEGATIPNFLGSGLNATITYTGGDGNDAVITVSTPTITVTGGPLAFGNVAYGQASAPQSYTVSGANLIDDIHINAPAGFEVSLTAGSGYGASLTLTQTGGSVSTTQIFVRFVPSGTGLVNANVTNASNNATTQNVGVSGTGVLGKFRSVMLGNWNNPTTWEISPDGSTWTPTSISPTSTTADTITVRAIHTVTVTATVNADQVTVASGGTLSVNDGQTLTIDNGPDAADLLIAGGGSFRAIGEAIVGGAGSFANSAVSTLSIGSTNGITTSGCGAGATCGNIRTASRTFDSGGTYIYDGFANQAVGNGLPASVTNLLIYNTTLVTGNSGQVVTNNLAINSGTYASNAATYHHVSAELTTVLVLLADINCDGSWNTESTITHNNHKVTFNGSTPQVITGSSLTFFDVTINNAAGVQLLSSMTINGTLTLQNGQFDNNGTNPPNITNQPNQPDLALFLNMGNLSTINRVNGTLTVAPNFVGEVDVTYNGSTPTTTGPELPVNPNTTSLRNLTINNTGGVSLSANATAHGVLALTGADLNTGSSTLTMPAAGSSSGTFDVVGNVKRTGFDTSPLNTTMSFGNPFNTIAFQAATTLPTDITVNLVKSAPADFSSAVQRTYTITPNPSNLSVFTARLRLHYRDSELQSNVEANLNLRRFSGLGWSPVPATGASTIDNWVESSAVTGFSRWTLSSLTPTASPGTITGRITEEDGAAVEGAVVHLSGGQSRMTITDAAGNYRFENVDTNGFYTVTPSRVNFSFSPAQRSFGQLGNNTEAVFSASANGGALNPLDTTEYFVRQQYLDFLNREPDEAGLNFWVSNIQHCGDNANCLAAKRVDTSAAFFLSIEFEQTGYLVYRTYRTAYGDIAGGPVPVRLGEFRPDTAKIGSGVIVNQVGWETVLENNKQAYLSEFVQRSRFVATYPATMTPGQFVDQLFMNARVTPAEGDRTAAIDEFGAASTSADVAARARALRRVAENSLLARQESNQAFVLMQYFGYLRRDPNTGPGNDFSGYSFWLEKLNSFNGNFRAAEMVKAFLVSGEYRGRFPR